MAQAINIAFWSVVPLLLLMALGYFLRIIKLLDEKFVTRLNAFCFKVFLPTTIFCNIYSSDFEQMFSIDMILFGLTSIFLSFILLLLIVPRFEKQRANTSVIIQGAFRSNYVFFGLPVLASIYGDSQTGVAAILAAFAIPVFNSLSVFVLESYSGKKPSALQIIKSVLKNPLIVASIVAFLLVFLGIKLPDAVFETAKDVSGVSTPLALILLGGSFKFTAAGKIYKQLIAAVSTKLVFIPLIFVTISVILGFRGATLAALAIMFASPTAVSSYTMAQSSGANHVLAGQIVVWSSIFSIVSLFFIVAILRGFAFI